MKKNYGYPSYNLICKATSGDEKAIREILDFYNAYISKVCLRPCYHANGALLMQVDEELKGEIHAEMMKAILKFEIRVKQSFSMNKGRYTAFMCYLPYQFYCHIKAQSIVVNSW